MKMKEKNINNFAEMKAGAKITAQKYDARSIERCIRQNFSIYRLSYRDFLSELAEGESLVEQAAVYLGVSVESLLDMDADEIQKWFCHFPYFALKCKLDRAYRYGQGKPFGELLAEMADGKAGIAMHRYDYDDVKRRFGLSVKELSGAAGISYLEIITETPFEFRELKEMMEHYLGMFDRFGELFFAAWDAELTEDEIWEYNFQASFLGAQDLAYPKKPLHYDLLKAFVPGYKAEAHDNILSYVKFGWRSTPVPAFWKSVNFINYPELAQRLADVLPIVKQEIQRQVMLSEKFLCYYLWSGEEKPAYQPGCEQYIMELLVDFGAEGTGVYHMLYVAKTKEELAGFGDYIDRLKRMAGAQNEGGLRVSVSDDKLRGVERVARRVNAVLDAKKK